MVQELLADGKKILFEAEDLSKVSFAHTDIARVRFSQITKWGQRDKFKIVEERELEEHLEYAKSIKHLLNRKDVMKEVEQRQTHFYDNKNYLDIEVNWNENSIKARAHNSSAEYEKNGKILKVQPNDLKIRFNQIKGIYGMLQESYKYRLRADEAGKFFVREMEAKRKELLNGNIREAQVSKFFREFWKLKRLDQLYEIYPQIRYYLPSFLKLHKALKKRGLNPNNVEWFADAIETGSIKIPEIQKQYAKIKDELEAIDYKKTMAKYELQNITNQIAILNRDIYKKRNEIAYLKIGSQELEGYVHGLGNHNQ